MRQDRESGARNPIKRQTIKPSVLNLRTLVKIAKVLKKARKYAKIVFKENDSQVVEDIITMMNTLGNKPVKKAFVIVAQNGIKISLEKVLDYLTKMVYTPN